MARGAHSMPSPQAIVAAYVGLAASHELGRYTVSTTRSAVQGDRSSLCKGLSRRRSQVSKDCVVACLVKARGLQWSHACRIQDIALNSQQSCSLLRQDWMQNQRKNPTSILIFVPTTFENSRFFQIVNTLFLKKYVYTSV